MKLTKIHYIIGASVLVVGSVAAYFIFRKKDEEQSNETSQVVTPINVGASAPGGIPAILKGENPTGVNVPLLTAAQNTMLNAAFAGVKASLTQNKWYNNFNDAQKYAFNQKLASNLASSDFRNKIWQDSIVTGKSLNDLIYAYTLSAKG